MPVDSHVRETGVSQPPVDQHGDVSVLPWTGERFIPTEGGPEVYYEHAHRYLTACSVVSGMSVVDLASGEGYGAAWMADAARWVVGVDIDQASVDHSRARYGATANLRFARCDIHSLPFADRSVEAVTCFEAIEHVEHPRRVVEEVSRILVPGGLFLVSTPNKAVYTDARDYTNDFHIHEFYVPELKELLANYFVERILLGQRLFAGSVTWPIEKVASSAMEPASGCGIVTAPGFHASGEANGVASLDPMYVLAACRVRGGPDTGLRWPAVSVLVDPEEQLLDQYRRSLDPGAAEALQRRLQEQEVELGHALEQLQTNKVTIAELGARTRQLEAEGRRAAALTASDLAVLRSALRHQQELATTFRRDLDAATELNMRLLNEIAVQQRSVRDLQMRKPPSTSSVPSQRYLPSARRVVRLLRRLARLT